MARNLVAKRQTAQDLADKINGLLGPGSITMGSDPSLVVEYLSTGVLEMDSLLGGGLPRGRFSEIFGDYCLAAGTMVLCADLHWRRLDALSVGDEIVGFDEQEQGKTRTRYRRAVVTSLGRARLPTYRIVNDKGWVTHASDGHLWLVRDSKQRRWKRTDELEPDDKIVWFGEPWGYDNSREAGWLAGVYDGEGWVTDTRVGVGQLPGGVLDNILRLLEQRQFDCRISVNGSGVKQVRFGGGKYQDLKFLGSIRPGRLVEKADRLWEGKATWSKISTTTAVVSVEPVGRRELVTIGTSTKTLIANGMLSHNSTLKSLIGLCAIAETQSNGGVCGLVDTEHAFDPVWASEWGVDVGALLMPFRDKERVVTGEEAVDATQLLVANKCDLVVWDSVAATFPQDEANKRLAKENIQPARLAALMSAAMRRLNAVNSRTAILCINQTRMKVGITFGSPESIPGGKALPFYASYRVAIRKAGKINKEKKVWDGKQMSTVRETTFQTFRAELLKSKLGSPSKEVYLTWDMKNGCLDTTTFLTSVGIEHGIISYTTKGKVKTWKVKGRKTTYKQVALRGLIETDPSLRTLLTEAALGGSPAPAKKKAARPRSAS